MKERIRQLIPAPGWKVIVLSASGNHFVDDLVAWALRDRVWELGDEYYEPSEDVDGNTWQDVVGLCLEDWDSRYADTVPDEAFIAYMRPGETEKDYTDLINKAKSRRDKRRNDDSLGNQPEQNGTPGAVRPGPQDP